MAYQIGSSRCLLPKYKYIFSLVKLVSTRLVLYVTEMFDTLILGDVNVQLILLVSMKLYLQTLVISQFVSDI